MENLIYIYIYIYIKYIYLKSYLYDKNTRSQVFFNKFFLQNVAKFTVERLCRSLFIQLHYKEITTEVNFHEFLRTNFLKNTSGRLFLL